MNSIPKTPSTAQIRRFIGPNVPVGTAPTPAVGVGTAPTPAPAVAVGPVACSRQYDPNNPTSDVFTSLLPAVGTLHDDFNLIIRKTKITATEKTRLNNTFKQYYGCDYDDKNYAIYYLDLYKAWKINGAQSIGTLNATWETSALGMYPSPLISTSSTIIPDTAHAIGGRKRKTRRRY